MRPRFHFTAESGWINDPHGITFRDGGYDVFYQYVPGQTVWGANSRWGHARGSDMFSLVERAPAILPDEGDGGIWTGSLVQDPAGTRIFYTSVDADALEIGRVRVARPTDDSWDTWSKGDIVIEAPPGLDLVGFRDPFLRRDPDAWRAFLGSGDTAGNALALSYVSQDLRNWTYEGVALERPSADRDPVWMGAMWECPQIFDLDERHVMLSSAWDRDVLNYAGYAVGRYEKGVFTAEAWGRLTYGSSYYAPSFFRDAQGRASTTLWMRGIHDLEAGWASAHSIPYLLSLDGDVLVATAHPDLNAYRDGVAQDSRVDGNAADITWRGVGRLEVSSGGSTLFLLDGSHEALVLSVGAESWEVPRGSAEVRVIVDGGSVEIVTDRGILGGPISGPTGEVSVDGEGIEMHALVRPESW